MTRSNRGTKPSAAARSTLLIRNLNALSEKKPEPFQPPLTKYCKAQLVERHLFHGGLEVEPPKSEDDIGLPWVK